MNRKTLIGIIVVEMILLIGAIIFCMTYEPNVMIEPTMPSPAFSEPIVVISVPPTVKEEIEPTEPLVEAPIESTEPIIEEDEPKTSELAEWVYDDNLSRKENIYIYLTEYLGFPEPAACGIISNIAHETGWKFNPKAGNPNHCYGLIQWMGGRLNNLKKWCKKNGKDYNSIQGQLDFMYWELTESDPYGTYEYLMKCTEGEDSAYDAGWYFCYWYERPANTKARARLRGRDANHIDSVKKCRPRPKISYH